MVQLVNARQELALACSQVPGIYGRRGGKHSRKIHSITAVVVLQQFREERRPGGPQRGRRLISQLTCPGNISQPGEVVASVRSKERWCLNKPHWEWNIPVKEACGLVLIAKLLKIVW